MADDAGGAAAAAASMDFPNYQKELARCSEFLEGYRSLPLTRDDREGEATYVEKVEAVRRRELVRFDIALDDVLLTPGGPDFVRDIQNNARRYAELFSQAIDKLTPPPTGDELSATSDIHDVLMSHRLQMIRTKLLEKNPEANPEEMDLRDRFPPSLFRRYEVRFLPLSREPVLPLREVRADQLGRLVTIKAIVIRASDIKPLVTVATYTCDECGEEIYQPVNGKTFMPISVCQGEVCRLNKSDGKVVMQTRGSKFVKYQELRVQELPEQVPVGHIPRSMTVIARGEATRECIPGDICDVTGIFLPTPYTGFQAMRAGLTADTYLEAHHIVKLKKTQEQHVDQALEDAIRAMADGDPYNTLSRSIAPEIYGHEDAKKALLLQLVGGVTQTQADGMKTRGDINICMMGDPGVAKSQLLKHIHKIAPRAVYTTGKGSSGVGLTAAVVKDPMTGELMLEGGALVLADMGICCIDEFDKMEEGDRTAIHEVMEQQTVSIAKAGITTTLNARTAILAAANPKYGRYNRRADPDAHQAMLKNINLPAALLSRFDLLFVMLDTVDQAADRALAAHITYVHQHEHHPPLDFQPADPAFIRQYISVCKHINPVVPKELTPFIVEAYVDMRAKDRAQAAATGNRGSMTARQLLSVLRMAQALARLEMRLEVSQKDVEEAIRLVKVSKASVLDNDANASDRQADLDALSRLYDIARELHGASTSGFIEHERMLAGAQARGLTQANYEDFLREYKALGMLVENNSRTGFNFVHTS